MGDGKNFVIEDRDALITCYSSQIGIIGVSIVVVCNFYIGTRIRKGTVRLHEKS